ncbi:TPA: histidine phosphatase family protein [Streptococcus suis]|nr:histidine phosphatase family protein [Streptococcus suis]HEM2671654.1 histidine phosphatase family protein [Streptococcus suis]HEP1782102.1 histidine phosphatase family protein [Streptococcus suis]
MKIYFVRHGKTEWNLEGRFQGYSGDSALLPESYQDLEKLGKYLAEIPFDAIYSSDLQRAHSTAVEIAKANHHCQKVETKSGFREWNFGRLEGTKIGLFRDIYPRQYHAFKNNVAIFQADLFDGETVVQATNRFINTLKESINETDNTILVVSHGAILTSSIRTLLGFPPALLRHQGGLDNASVTILETSDFENFTELAWNDTSYKTKQ